MSNTVTSPTVGSRWGMNPSRTKRSEYRPARVTAAVLVHIPHQTGYYERRLSVLQTCLSSLVQHADAPFDLMVFDNGSCREVRDYLQQLADQGRIRFLLQSQTNLGKVGALRIIFGAAPGDLVAYSDDDFYFHPGWLKRQLQIVDAFPKAGMVSGYVIPAFFSHDRISANLELADAQPAVVHREGKFISEDWIQDWALSTGREPAASLLEQSKHPEHLLESNGVIAYAAANHDQFLAPRQLIAACLPRGWSGNLMGDMLELDRAVNAAGYLRLSTRQLSAQHLGNRLAPADISAGGPLDVRSLGQARAWKSRFLRWKPVRFVLLGVYSRLFRWINPE